MSSAALSLAVTSPNSAMSDASPAGAGAAHAAPKQLHPSESQLQAEAELGITPDGQANAVVMSASTPATAMLAAPKPVVIETRTGPVSPKVSPRTLSRSPLNRSPAYSANSSPRGSSRTLGGSGNSGNVAQLGSLNMSGVDEVSPMMTSSPAGGAASGPGNHSMERRGSGSGSSLSNLLHAANSSSATSSPGGSNAPSGSPASNSGAQQLTTPQMMVRRASKPMVLSGTGINAQMQSFLSRFTAADLIKWKATGGSPAGGGGASPHPSSGSSPSLSPSPHPNVHHGPPHVIELPSTATPAEGFELLLKNNILSCPVYDAQAKAYTGFLDVRDLVSSIVFASEEQNLTATFHDQWNERMLQGLQRFGSAVSVTYLSRRNPFRPMQATASLLQVAKALSTQLHRVPIVDAESGKCTAIVSQSTLVQFLNAHREELKDELRQTVGALQLGLCKVVSVASDASAWQAFKTLEVNAVSGIAIVDRDGKLVGNTSARDLKFFVLNRGNLSLDAPIQVYLARIRQRDVDEARHPSCSVGVSTSIGHVIGLLSATGYHRVFVVDALGKPIGVVSITDILRLAVADSAAGGVGSSSGSPPSNPTTPRGGPTGSGNSKGSSSPLVASNSPPGITPPPATASSGGAALGAAALARTPVHLRTHSQSHTPIVTPPVPQ